MKTLSSILQQTSFELTQGDLAMEISSLTFDSRKAEKGSVFIHAGIIAVAGWIDWIVMLGGGYGF